MLKLLLISTSALVASITSAMASEMSDALTKRLCQSAIQRNDVTFKNECTAFLSKVSKSNTALKQKSSRANAPVSTSPPTPTPATDEPSPIFTSEPFFLLRQDQFDQVSYALKGTPLTAIQGASLNFMLDNKAGTQNLSAQSYLGVSFAQFTDHFRGVGAFIYADGTYTVPQKSSEASALRFGGALEEISVLDRSQSIQFDAYPYIQTDFRGHALIGGGDFVLEYFDGVHNIGLRNQQNENHIADTYLRILPELNVFDVDSAGLTRFRDQTAYAFVGGTLGARTVFFEDNASVSPYLCGHVYLNTAVQGYVNALSGKTIGDFNSELGYNLAPASFSAKCKGGVPTTSNATVALDYFLGTDPATYLRQNQLKLALKLKF